MRSKPKLKKKLLFNPDELVTSISQALSRDLATTHEYMLLDGAIFEARSRQSSQFLKKYGSASVDAKALEKLTFEKFLNVNQHLADFRNVEFPDPTQRLQSSMHKVDKIYLRARALMHFVLTDFDEDEWFLECKNSSGSSIGVPFTDTSLERKFTFPISTTARALPRFKRYLAYDTVMRESIDVHNGSAIKQPYSIEEGSRATTVDKTNEIRRFICIEPTANMFLQQGLMLMIYRRMAEVGLNVESLPSYHQHLAKLSSLSGRNATIDWSSASDCMTNELLRFLLPPKWFAVVNQTRCDRTTINGESVELNMVSTMGNAVTFPLETLVFWTFAHACLLSQKRTNTLFPEWENLKCCSVFGDDCIVPSNVANDFIDCMTRVGFMVNDEKSFYGTERFRESCGGDFLAGYNVRPYCVRTPSTNRLSSLEPWLYNIFNQLLPRYISYFGSLAYVYDREFFTVMFDLFAKHNIKIKIVPATFPDDSGLKLGFDLARFEKSYRMNLSPIYVSQHGTVSFQYCRFVYNNQRKRSDAIRYATWLKKPMVTNAMLSALPLEDVDELSYVDLRTIARALARKSAIQDLNTLEWEHKIKTRRLGGYVVARGVTSHWDVPSVDRQIA